MEQQNTDPADPGANGNPDSNGPKATPPEAPVYTKSDLTAKITREVGKVAAERDALSQRLAALEDERRQAEEAKLSAVQRQELERKREREALDAKIAALEATAKAERTRRHEVLREGHASRLAAQVAAQVANPGLLPHVERSIAERLVVEDDGKGGERVVMRMGAEGDNEPLESAFPKFRDSTLTPFFKVDGGSGAPHGASAPGGGKPMWAGLSATDKIARGLK